MRCQLARRERLRVRPPLKPAVGRRKAEIANTSALPLWALRLCGELASQTSLRFQSS